MRTERVTNGGDGHGDDPASSEAQLESQGLVELI